MGNEMHFPLDGRTSLLPPRGIAREIYGRLPSGLFVVRWNGPPPSRASRFDKWVARLVESHNPYDVRGLLRHSASILTCVESSAQGVKKSEVISNVPALPEGKFA